MENTNTNVVAPAPAAPESMVATINTPAVITVETTTITSNATAPPSSKEPSVTTTTTIDTMDSPMMNTSTMNNNQPHHTSTAVITIANVNETNNNNNNGNAPTTGSSAAPPPIPPLNQPKKHKHTTGGAAPVAAAAATDKGNMDADDSLSNFKVLYVVTQLVGLTLIIMMGSWIGVHMGGLGGTDTPSLEFNWHPLFMTIGLIFLYGNSILVYRGFRHIRKKTLKLTHAAIHMAAFVLTVIALKTVFDSHNLAANPIPNMYSLHSWLGLSAVLIFCMQYVAGFVAYLSPGLRESYRIALMPLHIYFGLFGFVLAIASALMGMTEKAIFSIDKYSALPTSGVVANLIGVLYVVFAGLVVYLVTEPSYKRKSIPEDTILLTGVNE